MQSLHAALSQVSSLNVLFHSVVVGRSAQVGSTRHSVKTLNLTCICLLRVVSAFEGRETHTVVEGLLIHDLSVVLGVVSSVLPFDVLLHLQHILSVAEGTAVVGDSVLLLIRSQVVELVLHAVVAQIVPGSVQDFL